MPDIDAELAASLKAAKSGTMFFAVVAKGANDGALLLSRSAVPANRIAEAKKKCGGGTLLKGRCFGEEGTLVFELADEPPPTLAKQIRTLALRDAGLSLNVTTRCNGASQEEPTPERETQESSQAGAAAEDLTATYTARLKAAGAALTQAIKSGAVATELKTLFGQATTLVTKKAFAEAEGPLAQLETRLKNGVPAAPAPPAATPPKPEAAALANRLKALAPKYLQASKSADPESRKTLENLFTLARTLLTKGDFAMTTAALSKLEALLDNVAANGAAAPPKPVGEKVAYAQLRLGWDTARKRAPVELEKLEQAILEAFKNEPWVGDLKQHVRKLDTVLEGFQEDLSDALDAALNAADEGKRRLHHEQAAGIVKKYKKYVETDPFIKDIEDNPFTKVNLTKGLSMTLDLLAKRLEVGA
jgi:tetratricopeptide (TPR) repeat protein